MATEATTGATEMATDAATDATDATEMATDAGDDTLDTLLTPEGFDADKLGKVIDDSDLDPLKKTVLQAAIEKAAENPELVSGVIDQVKAALGL